MHAFRIENGVRVSNLPRPTPQERAAALLSCRHRGEATGREIPCGECGARHVMLPVLACTVHKECTLKAAEDRRMKSCRFCHEREARAVVKVHIPIGGIGDHLCVLLCAEGLRRERPEADVVYSGEEGRLEWVRLLGSGVLIGDSRSPTYSLDINIYEKLQRQWRPRWDYWAAQCGTRPTLPPRPALPPEATAWAARYAGRVALSPFAAHAVRTWPLENWLEVERLLISRGLGVVVIDEARGRCERFASEKVEGETPARVCALIAASACLAGNDSGMAHVAGFLRTPAVAVCSFASDHRIFEIYPTTTALGGRSGGGHASVKPYDVLRAVEECGNSRLAGRIVRRESDIAGHTPEDRAELFTAPNGTSVETEVGELLQALVRCYKPDLILETGTYLGETTLLLASACRRNGFGKVISLERDPNNIAEARHSLRAYPEAEVIQADALEWLRRYDGPPFGFVLLDSNEQSRVKELKVLRDRKLAGSVLVHDTSRTRNDAGLTEMSDFPAALDALGLPCVENPLSRGWRLFDLRRWVPAGETPHA